MRYIITFAMHFLQRNGMQIVNVHLHYTQKCELLLLACSTTTNTLMTQNTAIIAHFIQWKGLFKFSGLVSLMAVYWNEILGLSNYDFTLLLLFEAKTINLFVFKCVVIMLKWLEFSVISSTRRQIAEFSNKCQPLLSKVDPLRGGYELLYFNFTCSIERGVRAVVYR